jgi:hypothetical protein
MKEFFWQLSSLLLFFTAVQTLVKNRDCDFIRIYKFTCQYSRVFTSFLSLNEAVLTVDRASARPACQNSSRQALTYAES